jgi:hypothetical protein
MNGIELVPEPRRKVLQSEIGKFGNPELEFLIQEAQKELDRRANYKVPEMSLAGYLLQLNQDKSMYKKQVNVSCTVEGMRYRRGFFEHFADPLTSLLVGLFTLSLCYTKHLEVVLRDSGVSRTFVKYDNFFMPWQLDLLKQKKKKYFDLFEPGEQIKAIVYAEKESALFGNKATYRIEGVEKDGKIICL